MAEYEKALVAYLDIMGFRQLIQESQNDYSKVDEIIEKLKKLKAKTSISFKRVISSRVSVNAMISRDFSDHVLRITPAGLNPIEHKRLVSDEFLILAAIQCELFLESGTLLRGAMCIDDLYFDNDIVFGPALVKAYEFENSIAIFPRIVVDLKSCLLTDDSAFRHIVSNEILQQGDDGAYFIDYLHFSYSNIFVMSEFKRYETQMLEQHKVMVEKNLREADSSHERIKQKVLWLARYHNSVLKRLIAENKGTEMKFSNLWISDDLIKF